MTKNFLRRLPERLEWAFCVPGDSQDEKLRKSTLALVSGLMVLVSPWWGLTYYLLGYPFSAAIPSGYSLFSALSLAWFYHNKRYGFFRVSQLLLILMLPFFLQWSLGGFAASSAVCIWAILAPLGALMFAPAGHSLYWLAGFFALLLASGFLESPTPAVLPKTAVQAFYVMNLGAVFAVCYSVLQYFVRQRELEQEKSERLLLNVLPVKIADRLKRGEMTIADRHQTATVLFADIVGFTKLSSGMDPTKLVELLNDIFSSFDRLAEKHGLEKIKTIGDAYMVVGGLPESRPDHAQTVARMALEMTQALTQAARGRPVDVRMGMHSGEVVAGVIGVKKFSYDLWGDTVNTASRMESHGAPGRIHLSEACFAALGKDFDCEERGEIEVKGKGAMRTYWLRGERIQGA